MTPPINQAARAALRALVDPAGRGGDLRLLRVGEKTLFRWTSGGTDVVLRVARPGVPADLLEREIAVARYLFAHGVPVAQPIGEVQISPAGAFSTWEWITDQGHASRAEGYAVFADLVARLHRLPVPSWLTAITPLTKVPGRLAGLPPEYAAERAVLQARYEQVLPWWEQVLASGPPVVCFGDVHLGNLLRDPQRGPLLIDLEAVTRAPAAWDVAPLVSAVRYFGLPRKVAAAYATTVGVSLDDPLVQACADIKALTATTWLGQLVDVSATHAVEFRNRVAMLRGEPGTPWRTF